MFLYQFSVSRKTLVKPLPHSFHFSTLSSVARPIMAFVSRLRLHSLTPHRRAFSTILSPDSATPLTSKQKTRAALSLLKSESNPEKITEICRAAALTPECHLDRIAFSVAIEKLTKSNNFSHIQQVVDGLRNSLDERYVSHAIILLGQANMIDDAIATFKEFHEGLRAASDGMGSVKVLNALLLACIFAKDYSQVKRVFVDFPDAYNIRPNLDTYNTVIKAFSESGSSSSVYSILAEMDRNAVKPDAASFGFCIAGFYKEEKYEDVGKVLNMMKEKHGMSPGLSVYNIRIQSLCKLKKSSEARALFDGLVARGMKPNAVTYSHLIYGFCKEGDLEEAKRLFKTMKGQGLQPDSQCYFTLVYFLCQGGEFETALAFAKESMGKDWVPNFSTMKSLVEGLAKLGKVEEAKKLVGKMKEKFTKNAHLWEEVEASLLQ